MKNVMIDIETMGDLNNSAIVSIGAVRFNLETGEIGDEFYVDVDLQDCLDNGLKVTGNTIKWWLTNSEESRKKIAGTEGVKLSKALRDFSEFIKDDDIVWSNGLRFDIVILENAYRNCTIIPVPWNFRNERDVRTLASFAPEIKKKVEKEWKGVLHNPIDDCKKQILYCSETYNKIKI
jgi:DNA polymerase III epsilon subunit-like protein